MGEGADLVRNPAGPVVRLGLSPCSNTWRLIVGTNNEEGWIRVFLPYEHRKFPVKSFDLTRFDDSNNNDQA